ncbi:MAG TPA: hypothetical protein VM529_03540 [Gemmata sp.]|jgi:hypothetical protein|nr:hypothetical protein [Gemmata sp.]
MAISFQGFMPLDTNKLSQVGRAAAGGGGGSDAQFAAIAANAQGDMVRAQLANAELMQRDRQFGDRLREEQSQFMGGLNRDQDQRALQAGIASGQVAAEDAQMVKRAQLASWLSQQQLSQKEKMQLQQEKKAVADVMAHPSLSPADKEDLILQLKTGIDSKTERLKREQIEVETQRKNAAIEEAKARTVLNEEMSQFRAKKADDRVTNLTVDKAGYDEIVEEVNSLYGGGRVPPNVLQAMIDKEAVRRGVKKPYFESAPGKWEPLGGGAAGEGASAGKGKAAGEDEAAKLDKAREQHLKNVKDALDAAEKAAKDDPNVNKDEFYRKRMEQLGKEAKLFDEGTPAGQAKKHREEEQGALVELESKISNMGMLRPEEKQAAAIILREMKELMAKPPEKRTPLHVQKFAELKRDLDNYLEKAPVQSKGGIPDSAYDYPPGTVNIGPGGTTTPVAR